MTRSRFHGRIAGVGTASGLRAVVGHWTASPLGPFSDVMVETAKGHRLLLAPDDAVADFVAGTYVFDEVRIEPVTVTAGPELWAVRTPSLTLDLVLDRRTWWGHLLRLVPARLAEAPAWCAVTDPLARLVLRGVRTRGVARAGRREWYAATDAHGVRSLAGSFEGSDVGDLRPVDPPCRFGFTSTPRRPSVTSVVTTVDEA